MFTPDAPQVTVIRPDYVGEDVLFANSKEAVGEWTIKVKKTWIDDEGRSYCQFYLEYVRGGTCKSAALMRVDGKGKVLEICSVSARDEAAAFYPETISTSLNYWTYYRK